MTAESNSDRVEEPEQQWAAMVIKTFSASAIDSKVRPEPTHKPVAETAIEWQKIGAKVDLLEFRAATLGLGQDRLHELAGCIAASGEQLGLSWTAEQESERWSYIEHDGKLMAARALADIRAHFALGATHGMGNATLRTLFLSTGVEAAIAQAGNKTYKRYAPFTTDDVAWPTFGKGLVAACEAGASAAKDPRVTNFVAVLRSLLDDSRYQALNAQRSMSYHRWRPQSLPAGSGVPQKSLWHQSGGARSLGIGGMLPVDPLADPASVAAIATNGMSAIAEAMRQWIGLWADALEGLGAKMFETS